MKSIFLDITRSLVQSIKRVMPTGIDRVTLAYIQHYKTNARAVLSIRGYSFILSQSLSKQIFACLLNATKINWKIRLWIIQEVILSWFKLKQVHGFLLNLSHLGFEFSHYPYFCKYQKIKSIFMIHDLIPITHPEYCRPAIKAIHIQKVNHVLNKAQGIITNSQATLHELTAYASQLNRILPPVVSAELACHKLIKTQLKPFIASPYFVMLGTIEGRKNHYLILQIWRKLVERLGSQTPKLVILGKRGWECEQVIDLLQDCHLLTGYVLEYKASDNDVINYLQFARALLFPSFAEGYGIPLIEALSLNVPVIASNLPVFYEIAGGVPEYIDPLDGTAWLKQIVEYTKSDSESRAKQLQRIAAFKIPTWEQHFAKVDAFLEQLSVIETKNDWQINQEKLPAIIYAYGLSLRKHLLVRHFLQHTKIKFVRKMQQIPLGATVVVWGNCYQLQDFPKPVQLLRLEDGFLRSVGLGAALTRPISWVIDTQGIYFDATKPSNLESILAITVFSKELLERAVKLRQKILLNEVTKYNVGSVVWNRPSNFQKIILVPGQVESDASLQFGSPYIARNIDLLQAVRHANPNAYIVYKPHPDVVAGLRLSGKNEANAHVWCNEIVNDISLHKLILGVDEVHVMTSLCGFEALLRNKKVVCYGQPFYAGWGLTHDIYPLERRTRKLILEELIVGALILYPTYISFKTRKFITPEQAIDELLIKRQKKISLLFLWHKFLGFILKYRAT